MRYFVLSAPPRGMASSPPDATTAGAMLPVAAGASPKALKWGFWGASEQLCGQPGTQRIPAPRAAIERGHVAGALTGWNGDSDDTPPYIYPSLYYVHGYQEHAPVSLLRTNNMPVPAVDMYDLTPGKFTSPTSQQGATQTGRLAQIAARSWHVGGRKATAWPAAPQRWGTR